MCGCVVALGVNMSAKSPLRRHLAAHFACFRHFEDIFCQIQVQLHVGAGCVRVAPKCGVLW